MEDDPVMDVVQTCEALGISTRTLYRRMEEGLITPDNIKPGALRASGKPTFRKSEVEAAKARIATRRHTRKQS